VAELQQVQVGSLMPALPGETDGFTVLRVDPGRSLSVGSSGPKARGIFHRPPGNSHCFAAISSDWRVVRHDGMSGRSAARRPRPWSCYEECMADTLSSTKRIGTGLSFVIFPIVFVFAFSVHPGLLDPHLLGPSELILRARGDGLLQFGHALVTLDTALLVVVALHFMTLLNRGSGAWAGFLGGALAVLGALALAADKGALCLTMSALNELSDSEFTSMMPGLLAMFSKQGWLVLLWGILLLPVGFGLQAIALFKSRSLPRWQSLLFLVGVFLIATPDGVEVVNLAASVLLTIALVPYGIQMIRREHHGVAAQWREGATAIG
jgi:hypothetical protein